MTNIDELVKVSVDGRKEYKIRQIDGGNRLSVVT